MKRFFIYMTMLAATLVAQKSLAFESLKEQADFYQNLYKNPAESFSMATGEMNVEETRPKSILKGVFYFGGVDQKIPRGGLGRTGLTSSYSQKLCKKGFSRLYSVYTSPSSPVSCDGNSMTYEKIGQANDAGGGSKVKDLMVRIREIIKANGKKGPIYVHCGYGVHASNVIGQMVAMQFCGISKSTARDNWDKVDYRNGLGTARPESQMKKIDNFSRFDGLEITDEERRTVCY